MHLLLIGLIASFVAAPPPQDRKPEAMSLLGKPLHPAPPAAEAREKLEANLAAARETLARAPKDPDALIWVGRRLAYLGRYREAIEVFSQGIAMHPSDARMYRHRGHRYITVRELDRAVADLSKAAELVGGKADQIEPDGQPNARNTPTSTLNSNIFYHLGLAHYLKADFDKALKAYRECARFSKNPDMLTATSHWLYMTLRRLKRDDDARNVLAPISANMDIIENTSYHKLLLMYKGETSADALLQATGAVGLDGATIGYGIGNWFLYNGRRDEAMEIFRDIVNKNANQWPSFGYIAAEAELSRGSR